MTDSKSRPVRAWCRTSNRVLAALLLATCGLPATARAAAVSYAAVVNGIERIATVDVVVYEGRDYVPLRALTEQFGGGYNILPTRMRIDLMGTTAWVQVNDDRVDALNIFTLGRPVRRADDEILIALEDVQNFFQRAFRIPVRTYTAPSQLTPPPETAPVQPQPDSPIPFTDEPLLPPASTVTGAPIEHPVRVIVIDAGHGGYDAGIEGDSGLLEKALALSIAKRVESLLRQALPQKIVLTRKTDVGLSDEQRATLAANADGDLLISIHGGGSMSPLTTGASIVYADGKRDRNAAFAPVVPLNGALPVQTPTSYTEISRRVAAFVADWFGEETAVPVRGVQFAPCRLLNDVAMPAVLIEVGCLTNGAEETELKTTAYQDKVSRGITKGIIAFLEDQASRERAEAKPVTHVASTLTQIGTAIE